MPGPAGAAGAETGRGFERGTSLVDVVGLASLAPWLGIGVGQGLPGARWWPTWSGLGLGSGPGQGARWRRTSSSQRPLPLELSEARSPPRRPGAARACARFVARFDHSSARFATLASRACARAASAHLSDSTWLGLELGLWLGLGLKDRSDSTSASKLDAASSAAASAACRLALVGRGGAAAAHAAAHAAVHGRPAAASAA